MAAFDATTISDQKRLARGEQWLLARSILRAFHNSHSSDYKIMTLAGGAPAGEIMAIKELMKSAHIVAVDRDEACVQAALEAGASEAIQADLADFSYVAGVASEQPAAPFNGNEFDVVNLDLCAGASDKTKKLIQVYRKLVRRPGVMMVTFSYGRDVVEFFRMRHRTPECLSHTDIPKEVGSRIAYLFDYPANKIQSVILYQGKEMPMCSVVIVFPGRGNHGWNQERASFLRLHSGDFELAVLHPDVRLLYDCPQQRIEALRRRHAALKAVKTRSERRAA